MNSMGPGEFGYYQILLQPEDKFDGGNFSKNYACSTTGEEFTSKELGNEYVESLRLGGGYKLIKVGDIIYDDYGNPRKTSKKIKEKYIDPADGKEKERDVTVEENMKYGDNYFNADEKKQGYKIVYLSKENEQNIKQEIKDRIKQVGNKLGKTRMRSIIRAMYIADKSHSNKVQNIQTTLALMRPFGSPGYNSFSPTPTSPFDND
ncbi:MAG: hypothetical protein QM532_00705 [Cyanobium sp. MAG06]|nr:hypothetical protein [Cyanobium sp. MAG06]